MIVIFSDAELQEAVGMTLAEVMHARAAGDIGVEHHEIGNLIGKR